MLQSKMPTLESEAKTKTKARFDEVFQNYSSRSRASNKQRRKTSSLGEQVSLNTLKNQIQYPIQSVYDTTIRTVNREEGKIQRVIFSREKVPDDAIESMFGIKEHKKSKVSKKKKVTGTASQQDLMNDPDSVLNKETMIVLKSDKLQEETGAKTIGDEIQYESDPNDVDDDDEKLVNEYNYQLSEQEAHEIKEKMKKKLKNHLSEHSVLKESKVPLLRNETTIRKEKKKNKNPIAAMERKTSASTPCESHGCSDDLCSTMSHDHIKKVVDFTENTKKKTKADVSRAACEDEQEEEHSSRPMYEDSLVLGIYIHRSDKLNTDLILSRPIVKIHIFDQTTGKYFKRENRADSATSISDCAKTDYILPLETQAYDFKRFKSPVPEWEEQIIFNERFSYFLKENEGSPNAIVFFEIIDISKDDGIDTSSELHSQKKGFQTIAWAFLKLVGTNKVLNVNTRLRLQLYFPPSQSNMASGVNVFDWWIKYPRNPFPSTLYVTVKGLKLPDNVNSSDGSSMAIQPDLVTSISDPEIDNNQNCTESGEIKKRKEPYRWTRLPGQACRIPNRLHLSLNSGHMGCFAVCFSNDGRTLAAACACRDGYPVYLYEIPSGQYLRELHGHLNVIYDLCWSKDDQHLLSSSSDSTVRLWKAGSESLSALKVLPHPSYVYTAKFHPMANSVIVTGCYDGVIRVWNVKVNDVNGQLLQEFNGHKSFINTLCFDSEGFQMYTGDGSGLIIIWNAVLSGSGNSRQNPLEDWCILKEIQEPDMKGIPVNHIEVHPNGRHLLIHTKDSTLSVMDLRILASKRYIGITNYTEKICSAFSTCGTFIFAGSEDGMAYVWNTETGDQVSKYSELSYTVPVRDVAFHPHENMVAFCAFGPSQPILIYIYDYKVAQMEADSAEASTNSENILTQGSYISAACTLAGVARTSMRMMKVKQKLDSVLNGSSHWLPAPSLLSPHSKLKLPGSPSTHLVDSSSSEHVSRRKLTKKMHANAPRN